MGRGSFFSEFTIGLGYFVVGNQKYMISIHVDEVDFYAGFSVVFVAFTS